MTFEPLNGNALLVELSPEDMKKFNITYETLKYDCNTEQAIRTILKDVPDGKYSKRGKITVEALPAQNGGCFFIFTFNGTVKQRYRVKNPKTPQVFEFKTGDDFLDFLNASGKIKGDSIKCPVYRIKNSFYLVFSCRSSRYDRILGEFGKPACPAEAHSIYERGQNMGCVII